MVECPPARLDCPSTFAAMACAACLLIGCRSPDEYRSEADEVAYGIVQRQQVAALGRTESFTIEPPAATLRRRLFMDQHLPYAEPSSLGSADMNLIEQWPDDDYFADREAALANDTTGPNATVKLTLMDALQVGARNGREYQRQKELVFQAALALDLEANEFRLTWLGLLDTMFSSDLSSGDAVTGAETTSSVGLSKKFKTGMQFTGLLAIDLVKLLTQGRSSSLGITADTSVSIPLLRGSSRFVVTEPLTQAERDVVYAIFTFERFKRTFAVQVGSEYLAVLRQLDQVNNEADSYRRLTGSTRRARRLADAGRRPEIQVDQARQDELRARNRWILAQQAYERRLDELKLLLGLPTDARIELDRAELDRLAQSERYAIHLRPRIAHAPPPDEMPAADSRAALVAPARDNAGPLELDPVTAIHLALDHRLDLRTAIGRIVDSQRGVAVAADNLRADLTLLGSASLGESRSVATADEGNAQLRFDRGRYAVLLGLDLPWERTLERNIYRNRLIAMERAVRSMQGVEDRTKLEVREALRALFASRETLGIQSESVALARRRVQSTNLFFERGEAEIRDVLDANDSLLSAENALTAALVNYRVAELELQRDMGLLQVSETGLWREYHPEDHHDDRS